MILSMAYRLDRTRRRPITVLSIAASDSGGGAGIQADLLTLAAHGVYGATAITAVTAQNTRGVFAAEPVRPELLLRQLETIFEDLSPAAVKIGALGSAANVRTVAGALGRWKARHVVLDPVLGASTGEPLLWRGLAVLRRELLSRCELVTPNVPEAEALSGVRIRGEADRRLAAGIIADRGAQTCSSREGMRGEESLATFSSTAEASANFAIPVSSRAPPMAPAARSPLRSPRTWRSATSCRKRSAARSATSRRRCGEGSFPAGAAVCQDTSELSANRSPRRRRAACSFARDPTGSSGRSSRCRRRAGAPVRRRERFRG